MSKLSGGGAGPYTGRSFDAMVDDLLVLRHGIGTWQVAKRSSLPDPCLRRYTGNEEYKSFCILRSILLIVVKHDSASLNCTKPRVERLVNHSLRGGSKA